MIFYVIWAIVSASVLGRGFQEEKVSVAIPGFVSLLLALVACIVELIKTVSLY